MVSPISNFVAEQFLLHFEHLLIKHNTENKLVLCHTRYVNDFIYDHTKVTITKILKFKKVKESHKKPGVAQRVPGGLGSQIS
jgi:hypothetical protein